MFDSKEKLPITGLIIAQDEEVYIRKAIANLLPNVAEVVVVDGGSTDRTVEIAKEMGCRVEHRKFDFDFSAQRNFGIQFIKTPWTLWLDADEYFEDSAFDAIASMMLAHHRSDPAVDGVAAYQFHRISTFDGRRVDDGNDFQWRLTRNGFARWSGKIHEGVVFEVGYSGRKLPKDFVLHHCHTMNRQRFNNRLYKNINDGIHKRPASTEGAEYRDEIGKWIDVPTDRNS